MEPSLTCVDWRADYLDALVIMSMLRAEGIDAFLPDDNMVRQNWFQALAYGGFRIVVPTPKKDHAEAILTLYREGQLAVVDDPTTVNDELDTQADAAACPHCHQHSTTADGRPRRLAFAALLAGEVGGFVAAPLDVIWLPAVIATAFGWIVLTMEWALLITLLAMLIPGLLRFWLLRRYCCNACGNRWWEAPSGRFADLQRSART